MITCINMLCVYVVLQDVSNPALSQGTLKEDLPATAFPGRLKRLRTELHRHNVTAAVIFDPINVRRKRVRARKMLCPYL